MILYQYVRYNVWANRRVADIINQLPQKDFYKEINSSFPSVYLTIKHILGAETVWNKRLQGISLTAFPEFPSDRSELMNLFIEQSEDLQRSVIDRSPDALRELQTFQDTKGSPYQQSVEEMIQHCINHSTYHRGQLMMMFRQLNVRQIQSLDFITYLRSGGEKT